MVILIPAFEPGHRLVDLIRTIRAVDSHQIVVIVDDGSGPGYAGLFEAARALGCDVIGHSPNRGKGFALKQGFAHIATAYPGHDVICADCDGQHTVSDLAKVAAAVADHPAAVVLGARQFGGSVPARSRVGNNLTRLVFRFTTGLGLQDTQTGLRGYPARLLGWLQTIAGDRFEYELEALLAARRDGVPLVEVPIETIYLEGNASSHFRPVQDSIRVYVPFVRFGLSSLAAFGLDASLFFTVMALSGNLAVSVVTARTVSAAVNYLANRRLVFAGRGQHRHRLAAPRYASLVVALVTANFALLSVLTGALGLPLVAAKLATELTLFLASYRTQGRHVFADRPQVAVPSMPSMPAPASAPVGVVPGTSGPALSQIAGS